MNLTPCGCNRSVAILSGLFASLAACALLAGDSCLDRGGRVSDVSWVCEMASGATTSLWALLSPMGVVLVVLVVGAPVYFAINAIGRRFIVACGLRVD